ncbi:ATP-binding protein [Nonomuraea guangzhouensis]|uniref:ATP-binding protein n=1 Tax=Nonomuraea guangzhouensis TaxID=1291555 RepID=A0ABW4G5I9_9ACTN|nr:ATP-binding protein [Nonomuraea guangzhouensis]
MKRPLHNYHDRSRTAFTNAPPVTWRREFPAAEVSVPEARAWAGSVLSVGGPPSFLDDALLLLSEVVTNAITHSGSRRVTVQIARTGTTVQVKVTDAGSSTTAPVVRLPALDDDGGRGLWLVESLAEEWGSCHDETSRLVWFRLAE